jgi:hypothetical protein
MLMPGGKFPPVTANDKDVPLVASVADIVKLELTRSVILPREPAEVVNNGSDPITPADDNDAANPDGLVTVIPNACAAT